MAVTGGWQRDHQSPGEYGWNAARQRGPRRETARGFLLSGLVSGHDASRCTVALDLKGIDPFW